MPKNSNPENRLGIFKKIGIAIKRRNTESELGESGVRLAAKMEDRKRFPQERRENVGKEVVNKMTEDGGYENLDPRWFDESRTELVEKQKEFWTIVRQMRETLEQELKDVEHDKRGHFLKSWLRKRLDEVIVRETNDLKSGYQKDKGTVLAEALSLMPNRAILFLAASEVFGLNNIDTEFGVDKTGREGNIRIPPEINQSYMFRAIDSLFEAKVFAPTVEVKIGSRKEKEKNNLNKLQAAFLAFIRDNIGIVEEDSTGTYRVSEKRTIGIAQIKPDVKEGHVKSVASYKYVIPDNAQIYEQFQQKDEQQKGELTNIRLAFAIIANRALITPATVAERLRNI